MENDFIAELGYLALAVRLKRISDTMIHSGRTMYKSLKIDIEPNWFLIFKLLKKHKKLSVMEIAGLLQFSHPSIITMLKKMKANGYLESNPCSEDARKHQVTLTPKAQRILPKLEEIWDAGELGVQNMLPPENTLLQTLEAIENQYQEKNFMQRTLTALHHE